MASLSASYIMTEYAFILPSQWSYVHNGHICLSLVLYTARLWPVLYVCSLMNQPHLSERNVWALSTWSHGTMECSTLLHINKFNKFNHICYHSLLIATSLLAASYILILVSNLIGHPPWPMSSCKECSDGLSLRKAADSWDYSDLWCFQLLLVKTTWQPSWPTHKRHLNSVTEKKYCGPIVKD